MSDRLINDPQHRRVIDGRVSQYLMKNEPKLVEVFFTKVGTARAGKHTCSTPLISPPPNPNYQSGAGERRPRCFHPPENMQMVRGWTFCGRF